MTFQWFEALPFVFSIVLKLFSNVFAEFFQNTFVRDVPKDYALKDEQKQTLASMAIEGNDRMTYIVTIFVSILSAAVISYKNQAFGYAVIAAFVYGLAGVLGFLKLNAKELGWLESSFEFRHRQVRRSTLLTVFLIVVVDLALLGLSILSSIPRFRF